MRSSAAVLRAHADEQCRPAERIAQATLAICPPMDERIFLSARASTRHRPPPAFASQPLEGGRVADEDQAQADALKRARAGVLEQVARSRAKLCDAGGRGTFSRLINDQTWSGGRRRCAMHGARPRVAPRALTAAPSLPVGRCSLSELARYWARGDVQQGTWFWSPTMGGWRELSALGARLPHGHARADQQRRDRRRR
mmetsp:Transcript_9351/g.29495  ORF Transcript_9351/g.29495 Transcript_9351/m.29495 type:complete len:198 (-) Transcript_9351:195-788(-)